MQIYSLMKKKCIEIEIKMSKLGALLSDFELAFIKFSI